MMRPLPRARTQTQAVEVPIIAHDRDPVHTADLAGSAVLDDSGLPDDPALLAASWVPAAGEDRMLMTLSTIDADGFPRGRTVMLSEFDGAEFFFHTDALSQKVADLAQNPKVSLTLLWPGFTRQLVIQGTARRASDGERAAAYEARSPYLQQLAWLNTAEFAVLPLRERVDQWTTWSAEHPNPEPPSTWDGYGVTPARMLFWVSHPNAASRRIEYARTGSGWARRILPG